MNAKNELLKEIGKIRIKCAEIKYEPWGKPSQEFLLKVGYSENDLIEFLDNLDFKYNEGYGSQELDGTVWLQDGTWLDRSEYDGLEWWARRMPPIIPHKLLSK